MCLCSTWPRLYFRCTVACIFCHGRRSVTDSTYLVSTKLPRLHLFERIWVRYDNFYCKRLLSLLWLVCIISQQSECFYIFMCIILQQSECFYIFMCIILQQSQCSTSLCVLFHSEASVLRLCADPGVVGRHTGCRKHATLLWCPQWHVVC